MHMIRWFRKQSGFSLTEILIAVAINVVLLSALVFTFSSSVRQYNSKSNADILNHQLQSALQLMTNDIRRAGYWSNAQNDIDSLTRTNPFMTSTTDIDVNSAKNCILFTYDHDRNGSISTVTSASDDEHYGFRLSNQTLQARPFGSSFSCGANASDWQNVTDPSIIQITNIQFTLNVTIIPPGATTNYMVIRSVDITITGRLTSNTAVTKTITQHVRLRNDKYFVVPGDEQGSEA